MTKSQDQTASYMMLCLEDFASTIVIVFLFLILIFYFSLIPAKFVRKYKEIDRQVSVMLETNDSEKSWDVKIKRMNGDLYMTDGWPEFVQENGIIELDFLTFRLLMLPQLFAFKVSIYRADGCIKHSGDGDVEILNKNVIKSVNGGVSGIKRGRWRPSKFHAGGEDVEMDENVIKRGRGRPYKIHAGRRSKAPNDVVKDNLPVYLEMSLKWHQKYRVSLPAAFWKVGGMRGRRDVMMEYVATGDCKSVVLDHLLYRTHLARGWPEFLPRMVAMESIIADISLIVSIPSIVAIVSGRNKIWIMSLITAICCVAKLLKNLAPWPIIVVVATATTSIISFSTTTLASIATTYQFQFQELVDGNYQLWKQQVMATIEGFGLENFLLEEHSSDATTSNSDQVTWRRQDQLITSWLISSITDNVLLGLLQTLKKGSLTMRDYLNKVKSCCDILAAAGE
ncbi:hypothetical protein C2S52_016408 [Perilla frutescens var. hirtella]|nr:hypothetical protein C2S52_016408 [Perilla frutescens var. hirtella]